MSKKKPLILVTNDDGIDAKGINSLIEIVKPFGEIVVVAPEMSQSGMSHAVTMKTPLLLRMVSNSNSIERYSCNGTPVDCVKIALNQVLDRKPDLLVSGINHGSNASISVIYSGTMGAAIEGCINGIPSIGFSLLDFKADADFSSAEKYAPQIIANILKNGIQESTCLNVNVPSVGENEIKGIKVCRQTRGMWKEEFDKRIDPHKREYYWLTGTFKNFEPEAKDTDEWALQNNYISIVPINFDLTSYAALKSMQSLNYEK